MAELGFATRSRQKELFGTSWLGAARFGAPSPSYSILEWCNVNITKAKASGATNKTRPLEKSVQGLLRRGGSGQAVMSLGGTGNPPVLWLTFLHLALSQSHKEA